MADDAASMVRAMRVYAASMAVFESYDSGDAQVLAAVEAVKKELKGPEAAEPRRAFEWWENVYRLARAAVSYDQIKAVARQYLCANHEHSATPYNIAQALMKATAHRLWHNLYDLRTRGHLAPGPAVLDAITPPQQRAVEYMQELFAEIAAEGGETVDEMLSRVCGPD